MRALSAFLLAICAMLAFNEPAFALKRIALVIGNSAYQNVVPLANPANDASIMSAMFKNAGFESVEFKRDLKATEMRRALRDFSDNARDADMAIVYFAGHGVEIDGVNYLVPVDAVLERSMDAYDEAISLDRMLEVIGPARQLRLVILDACRDNPFSKTMKRTASRGIERGLAKVEPVNPNTMIAYAAKAGSTAADGDDKNSPFATALVKYLPKPGLDLRKAFGFVRDDVLKATANRQEPFIYGSLGGEDVSLVPMAPKPVDPYAEARRDYELTQQINVPSAWDSFIGRYPSGFYTDLAKAQRDRLRAAQAAAAEEALLKAEKKSLPDTKQADNERIRLAAQEKMAHDASVAAEKNRIAAAAKAADEQKAFEKQRAAEAARVAQEREAVEKRKAAEAAKAAAQAREASERQKVADAARATQEREAAARQKAVEAAKVADASRAKAAAQAKADSAGTVVAALDPKNGAAVQDPKSGGATRKDEPLPSQDCFGASIQPAPPALRTAVALSPLEECGLRSKDVFRECENCPDMVMVPAGEVVMGSNRTEIDNGLAAVNEGPQRRVNIRQPIAVGRFEVTRDQYAAFVRSSGYKFDERCFTFEKNIPQERDNRSYMNPGFPQNGDHPVVCVSWASAKAYAEWLSKTTGKTYRLLSEAEYEYVARAGSPARFGFGNDPAEMCKFANGADLSAKEAGLPANVSYMNCKDAYPFTAPVGSFAANAFGFYDLIGNVWEWTEDCFYGDYATAKADSSARSETGCSARTVRGGDWFSTEASLRPAARAKANFDARHDDIGFRVARTLDRF